MSSQVKLISVSFASKMSTSLRLIVYNGKDEAKMLIVSINIRIKGTVDAISSGPIFSGMSDSLQYHLNLYLTNNAIDIVFLLCEKVLNSYISPHLNNTHVTL